MRMVRHQVSVQHYYVEDDDVPSRSDYIGNFGRSVWSEQYRRGINLPVTAEEKSAVPRLWGVDDKGS